MNGELSKISADEFNETDKLKTSLARNSVLKINEFAEPTLSYRKPFFKVVEQVLLYVRRLVGRLRKRRIYANQLYSMGFRKKKCHSKKSPPVEDTDFFEVDPLDLQSNLP